MINARIKAIILLFIFIFSVEVFAEKQQSEKVDLLKQKIQESKTTKNLSPMFDELMDILVQDNRFDEFYNFLGILEKKSVFKKDPLIYYYKVLTRFKQMQFLEENKMWQELFDNKAAYVADLDKSLAKAKELSTSLDALVLRLRFLEWQVKKDSEQAAIETLEILFNSVREYVETEGDIGVIKNIADELSKEKEINYAKKLYSVYVSKLSKMDVGLQELKVIIDGFLKEDRIGLAVSLYDVYLDKMLEIQQDKNVIIKEMFAIAEKFAHTGWQEGLDPFFANKIYGKIETLYKIEAFDTLAQYRKAYNLERIKEYDSCFAEYLKLVNNFPTYQDKDRIYFRLGVLSAYIFDKIDQAREYFLKVVNDYPKSQDYLNSLYHLGLLYHWQGNLEKAKEFYSIILEKTKEIKIKPEIVTLTEQRIKEIEQNKDIEYNLRMFLEAVLNNQKQKPYLELELFARTAKDYLDETVKFEVSSYFTDTGCLQQDFTYLWSGELGNNQNPLNEYEFETSYQDLGTKVVNVVLVESSGIVDGTIEMADIYKK